MYKYGFIGTGNMGSALAKALVEKCGTDGVALSNRTPEKAESLAATLGCKATTNADIMGNSQYVILGVKPQTLPGFFDDFEGDIPKNTIIVTMAAGVKTKTICEMAGGTFPVIRIMPNTPVSIGEGVILAYGNDNVSDAQFEKFISDFEKSGTICRMEESMIDAASVISGCGPAYIYMYIEALAKAGVSLGLPYETAAALAKATTRGAATLSQQSTKTLEVLKQNVCSPGGSTIEGVKSLENSNINSIVEEALSAAFRRTKELAGE